MPLIPPEQIPDTPFIGLIDSGIGGLTVMREIARQLPGLPMLYYADQAHLPYGPRPYSEIYAFVAAIAHDLIEAGAAAVVIPCHSACAAGLVELRARWPAVPFIGLEPAIKPAAEATRSGVIGALMTQATADGALYRHVCERYAAQVRVLTTAAPALVGIVEAGTQDSPAALRVLRGYLEPMLAEGIDQLVLACTHFPFLAAQIRAITGPGVALVDPAPGVARQVARVLAARGISTPTANAARVYLTSGDGAAFQRLLRERQLEV